MKRKIKLSPKEAERLQNEIYRKMSAAKKIKIAGEFFLLGKKLNDPRRTSLPNSKNFRKTWYSQENSLAKELLLIDVYVSKEDIGDALKRKGEFNFISPEDLILSKLIWYKESQSSRHLEDITSILKISKPNLNYIKKWAKKQSTIKILEDLRRK